MNPPVEIISKERLWHILEHPLDFPWRSHGIGMLRVYIDEDGVLPEGDPGRHLSAFRLHLWHRRLLNPGITTMHTHPWRLRSWIIAGQLQNVRFSRSRSADNRADAFHEAQIGCGVLPFRGLESKPGTIYLRTGVPETYVPGTWYDQEPEEIHESRAKDGTISLIHRDQFREDGMASVFWPHGRPWGDASRDTTREDVLITTAAARRELEYTLWRKR
jgi:hypothetical protein